VTDTPVSTYRLQLDARFDFDAARDLLPYFRDLGVDWLYVSPIFTARPGSLHGYDVVDPTAVNPELGGRRGLEQLADAAHAAGMKILLDIVPNHEAVTTSNPHWFALLRDGQDADIAWFDVDWTGNEFVPPGKILWGLLTEDVNDALAAATLRPTTTAAGAPALEYGGEQLPLRECEPQSTLPRRLGCQHYQLAHWRAARDFLNYRRFFDVSELAGVRVEDPAVFRASHALVFELLDQGVIDGLRVDHVDGLAEPGAYLQRLAAAIGTRPVFVEKILTGDESLPPDWPVCGTTGYETTAAITAVLLDPDGLATLTRVHDDHDFAVSERFAKRDALRELFVPEWRRLKRSLRGDALTTALEEVTVALGVYRTYLGEAASERVHLDRAFAAARREGVASPDALDALYELLTASDEGADRAFVVRWEQLCAAVMAKGREDTALYRSPPSLALADVGCDPGDDVRDAVARFHAQQVARVASGRPGMTTTTTHDTKRSEDTRARLAALTELADAYVAGLDRWIKAVEPLPAVSRAVCDFVAQTLLASWPLDPGARLNYGDRIGAYLVKAMREAKQATSWLAPDATYESGVVALALRSIAENGALLRAAFGTLLDEIAWFGAINGLAQLTWKLGLPGTCDIYRGTEFWDLSLVDPDNRRPVDFDARTRALRHQRATLTGWASGAVKLHMTRAGLRARRAHRALFQTGAYVPLSVAGDAALAFARHDGDAWAVACAPRLPTRLAPRGRWPTGGAVWESHALDLPAGAPTRWVNVYSDSTIEARDDRLRIADLCADFPAALLVAS
jgi:(1->4)-alpha-D-glucan 1-alpha-D-glucosylmutase